jgi:predicted transcriptional regulator
MKKIIIGILPQDQIRARAIAIAKGQHKPRHNEPKVWFPSMRSLAEVLSDRNRALLRAIAESAPSSVAELARATGRAPGNLLRTLNTLANYGFVELQRESGIVRPIAKALEFEIHAAA